MKMSSVEKLKEIQQRLDAPFDINCRYPTWDDIEALIKIIKEQEQENEELKQFNHREGNPG